MTMWTKQYWQDLAERVAAGAATGLVLAAGGDVFNALTADWETIAGMTLGGGVFSLAKGLLAKTVGDRESAAFLPGR